MKSTVALCQPHLLLYAAIFCLLSGLCQPVFGAELVIVALANTQAPGFASGRNFRNGNFTRQSVNAFGKVVFKTIVTGPNVDVIYFGRPGALEIVAVENTPAPGTVGEEFCNLDTSNPQPSLIAAKNGTVAFAARAKAPEAPGICSSAGRLGIWVWKNGVIQLLALEGEPAADSAEGVIYSAIRPKFRHSNQGTIFLATLFDTGTGEAVGQALMTGQPGSVQILALIGDPAPDQAGKAYAGFTNHWPHNNTGQSSFFSWFNAPASDQGIYRGDTTLLELLWKSQANASDFIDGYSFNSIQLNTRDWGLNDAAHGCFSSKVSSVAPDAQDHDTVWRDLGPSRGVVASTAGSDTGIVDFEFSGFNDCWINRNGRVLFRGTAESTIDGENRNGLWLSNAVGEDPGLSFITSVADTLVNGVEPFIVHFSPANANEPHINKRGNVTFEVNVVNTSNEIRESIWLSNGSDEELLVHSQQAVTLENQPAIIGPFLDFSGADNGSGNQDGNPSAISDNDEVVFNTTTSIDGGLFTDVILITTGRGSFIFGDSFETQPFPPPD